MGRAGAAGAGGPDTTRTRSDVDPATRVLLALTLVATVALAGCAPGSPPVDDGSPTEGIATTGAPTTRDEPDGAPPPVTPSPDAEVSTGAPDAGDVGASSSAAAEDPDVATGDDGEGDGDALVLPAVAAAPPAAPLPMFRGAVAPIGPELADRMTPTSWRPGCPVPLEDLRYVTVSHVTFDGTVATGELVVHADVADGVVQVFANLFASRYPVRSMRLVDDFGGDDTDSMDADNTSAFNCRAITGGTEWSEHAYGRALDLNPVENPYVLGRHVAPTAGRAFADRPDVPGVIHADDAVVQAFAAAGWQWGGYWDRPIDYQHFSVSGR